MQSIIDQLNETLHKAEEAVKANGKVHESHIDKMMELTNECSTDMFLFDEEVKRDESAFLKISDSDLRVIKSFDQKLEELRKGKLKAVEQQDYEKAARLRDEMHQIQREKYQSLIRFNELKIGFNDFNNSLLLITDQSKNSNVVDSFVERYRF